MTETVGWLQPAFICIKGWLTYGRRKYDHVTPLLRELHWLRVPERITFRLATLAYRYQHNMAPHYLAVQLNRQRLRSASTSELIVPRTVHSTVGDPCKKFLCDRSSGVEHLDTVRAVLWVTCNFSTSPEDRTVLTLLPRLTISVIIP